MAISLTTPVTGSTMSQFTTPTYTVVQDKDPDINAKQWVVTALGGTQTGVRTHAVSDPFTVKVSRPKVMRTLPSPNAITGKYPTVPQNNYVILARKGVNFAANNAPAVAWMRIEMSIPAGSDAFDSANVRALVCAAFGVAAQQSQGVGDTGLNGVL